MHCQRFQRAGATAGVDQQKFIAVEYPRNCKDASQQPGVRYAYARDAA
ncbi:hypothetical protein MPS_4684 [Mycobacterium pseudoshottsii JCM 15466]|nr:hypothetical protein MPS_4684 [Mycobacterium pseudoshottsii JCM 15466]